MSSHVVLLALHSVSLSRLSTTTFLDGAALWWRASVARSATLRRSRRKNCPESSLPPPLCSRGPIAISRRLTARHSHVQATQEKVNFE